MSDQPLHRDTLAVRAAAERSQYGENSEALYLTSGYVQPSAEAAARRFAGDEDGFTYGRYGNPTVASFEQRLAALEGAEACISTASGMSAILMMCMGLLKAGDHVVCSRSMFGSTIKLIGSDLAKFGVESSFVPPDRPGRMEGRHQAQHPAAVRRNAHQPPHRGVRHPRPGRPGPQRRRLALRGQLLRHPGPAAAHRAGR